MGCGSSTFVATNPAEQPYNIKAESNNAAVNVALKSAATNVVSSMATANDVSIPPPNPAIRIEKSGAVVSTTTLKHHDRAKPLLEYQFTFSTRDYTNGGYNSANNPQFLLNVKEDREEDITIRIKRSISGSPGIGFRIYETDSYLLSKPKEHIFESLFYSSDEMDARVSLKQGVYNIMVIQNWASESEGVDLDDVSASISISKLGISPIFLEGVRLNAHSKLSKCSGGYQSSRQTQFLLKTTSSTFASITMKVDRDLNGIMFVLVPANQQEKRLVVWPKEDYLHASPYVKTRSLNSRVPELLHPKCNYIILVTGCLAEDSNIDVSVVLDSDRNATLSVLEYIAPNFKEDSFDPLFKNVTGMRCPEFPKSNATIYDVKEARNLVQSVMAACKKGKSCFVDKLFPANESSLNRADGPNNILPRVEEWNRISELANNPVLFSDGTDCNDIIQGQIGDCQFASAVASLSLHQTLVEKMFFPSSLSPCGIYAITLYFDGQPCAVIIDDKLPSVKGQRIFAAGTDPDEFWFSLLEKAFAKLVGNYASLMGRFKNVTHSNLFSLLINGEFSSFKMSDDVSWLSKLKENVSKKWPVCALSVAASPNQVGDSIEANGLVFNHAYTVLDVVEEGSITLIKIRNTWGKREWIGDWSDSSPLWVKHQAVARRCGVDPQFPKNDGIFWISKEAFEKEFEQISLSSIPDSSFSHTSCVESSFQEGSCVLKNNILCNTQILLTSKSVGCSAQITLRRLDQGQLTGLQFKIFDFQDEDTKNPLPTSVETASHLLIYSSKNYVDAIDVRGHVNFPVTGGRRFVIVPLLLKEDKQAFFRITVNANQYVDLKVLPPASHLSLSGCWKSPIPYKDAKNPKSIIFVKKECSARLELSIPSYNSKPMGIQLFVAKFKEEERDCWPTSIVAESGFIITRTVEMSVLLQPGTYWIIPVREKPLSGDFKIDVHCNQPECISFECS